MMDIDRRINRLIFTTLLLFFVSGNLYALDKKGKRKRKRRRVIPTASITPKEQIAPPFTLKTDTVLYSSLSDNMKTMIKRGEQLLGKPYKARGIAPWALDCSGYVSYLYKQMGIDIPRSSSALSVFTQRVDTPQPGDLLFFKGRNASAKRVGHVALVVSNDDGDPVIMHSTCSRGIIKHRLSQMAYFSKRYLFAGRVPEVAKLLGEQIKAEN